MALQKSMMSTFGVNAEYWRVTNTVVDQDRKMARITMGGYPTQEVREGDNQPLMKLTVNCLFDKFDEFFSAEQLSIDGNNPLKAGYDYAKTYDDFFKDAIDILEEEI